MWPKCGHSLFGKQEDSAIIGQSLEKDYIKCFSLIGVIGGKMDGWMDDMRLYVLFNIIIVISGRWADDNESLVH